MMKKSIYGWATLLLLVFCASVVSAQTPKAIIKIEGYSPQEIHDLGWVSPRSTGLSNVGIGQVVYLVGRDSLNAAVTSYAWTLTSKPSGSTAVLDSATTKQITFKPDVQGKFVVQLVITTAGGTSTRSVVINSAKFVGVGGMDGLPADFAAGQCSPCHNANFLAWEKTEHSKFFTEAIDGLKSPGYNESCIECHTTGFDEEATAVNDGFDDVATELGWTFPATLQAGNWDSLKAKYPKLAHRANIQCESCHGPGSQHIGDKSGIALSLEESACGYCHEEAPYHRINTQWKASRHSSTARESQANNASCSKCHSGWGFIRRIDPKIPDNRPTLGFPQISCGVCHDPHRSELLQSQVRSLDNVTLGDSVTVVNYGGMGKLCMQCHISRRDGVDYSSNPANLSANFGPHYSNQADMIDGSNAIEYDIPIGSSGHKHAVANACVTCHMQATPATGQPGHDKVGQHTFAVKWDGGTPADPTDDVENVAICQTCHGPIASFDDIIAKADFDEDGTIEGTRHEIEGLLHKIDTLLPPRTNTTIVKQNFDWTLPGLTPEEVNRRKALTKAWYNLRFVEEDGSMGVHNAGYSIALLRRSIASLTTGDVGATEIISITDVPNDQGKHVAVAWSKFPGDGVSTNPVTSYGIWRIDEAGAAPAQAQVGSKEEMFAQAITMNIGKSFTLADGEVWTFVGNVPALGGRTEFYNFVAPTLFDSTAAGIYWSRFVVTGGAGGQVTYATAVDSGYSVDNLAPFAPSNATASVAGNVINLQWDDPVDVDFQYFVVYRSTSNGFDPKTTPPLARLTGAAYTDNDVVIGNRYYYRISAFDFAGNQSPFSPQLEALVTSVDERSLVPTEFALQQNYPNPFNPETTIRYQLPAPGQVRLSIYTVLGQEVRMLVDRSQPAAYHTVVWDGRDSNGNTMPSGVYFYRIESGKFTAMKKMVMLK